MFSESYHFDKKDVFTAKSSQFLVFSENESKANGDGYGATESKVLEGTVETADG